MKRLGLVVTIFVALALSIGTANAQPRHGVAQDGPCIARNPIKPVDGPDLVRRRVRHLVACSVRTWPVPGGVGVALCIARRESGPNLWPWSTNGSYRGVFQQSASYWRGRSGQWWERRWMPKAWPTNPLNARQNVIVSIRMMHAGGLGPWGGC